MGVHCERRRQESTWLKIREHVERRSNEETRKYKSGDEDGDERKDTDGT